MIVLLLSIVSSIIIGVATGLGYHHFIINNNLLDNKLPLEELPSKSNKYLDSYFIKIPEIIIFDCSLYTKLKFNIDTHSKIIPSHYSKLLSLLKDFYILESKFKTLEELNLISKEDYTNYINSIRHTITYKYSDLYDHSIKNRPYSFRDSHDELNKYVTKINKVTESYGAVDIINNLKIKDIEIPTTDLLSNENLKDELLIDIKNKNDILDNVISNSLFNNAKLLIKTKNNPALNTDGLLLIDSQLEQINSFLEKEINEINTLSYLEIENKLKANQIYLDSLETHWTSEIK